MMENPGSRSLIRGLAFVRGKTHPLAHANVRRRCSLLGSKRLIIAPSTFRVLGKRTPSESESARVAPPSFFFSPDFR